MEQTTALQQEPLTDGQLWGQAQDAICELQKRGWLALAIGFPSDDSYVRELSSDGRFTDDEVSQAVKATSDSGGVDTVSAFLKEAKEFIEDMFSAAADARETKAEALANPVTDAFVVTEPGDAPVKAGEIVTSSQHAELTEYFAAMGYVATPVTLSKRTVDSIAAGVEEKIAATAGKS